jgi:hypothetical protein
MSEARDLLCKTGTNRPGLEPLWASGDLQSSQTRVTLWLTSTGFLTDGVQLRTPIRRSSLRSRAP